jgi:hypothetical protein
MRNPISGTFTSVPTEYTYSTRVEYAPYYPDFQNQWNGNYGDNFFDLGLERRVSFSMAGGSLATWLWSPNTSMGAGYPDKGTVNRGLRIGTTDGSSAGENVHPYYIEYYTRPDVGPGNIIGTIEGGNLIVRSYDPIGLVLTQLHSIAHACSQTDGLSVSVVSANDVWVAWIQDGVHKAKQYNGTSWGTTVNLCAHVSLLPWHATGFRVLSYNGGYVLLFSSTSNSAVCRFYKNGLLSEKMPIVGADSEYAFQYAMVTGASIINGIPFVVVQKYIEDSAGDPSSPYSSVLYSSNLESWTDWCGVSAGVFRGNIVSVSDKLFAGSVSRMMNSVGTSVTGNATWTNMGSGSSWSYDSRKDMASTGSTSFIGVANIPLPGYSLRRYITVGTTEFLYSTESVDTCPATQKSSGFTGNVSSRGPIKYGIAYLSSVDEVYSSGEARIVDFSIHSTVSKSGTWTHDADLKKMTVSEDDGDYALTILPEPIYDSFWYTSTSDNFYGNAGPAFFVVDSSNYWRIRHASEVHYIERIVNGVVTNMGSFPHINNDEPNLLLYYHDGVLDTYLSRPSAFSTASDYMTHLQWVNVSSIPVGVPPEKFYVGYMGKNGASVRSMHLRRSGIEQTIGSVASAIAARSGMVMTTQKQVSVEDNLWKTTTTPIYHETQIDGYDIYFDIDMNAAYLGVALGGKRSTTSTTLAISEWPCHIRIDTNKLSLYTGLYNGSSYAWSLHSSISLAQSPQVGDKIRVRISRTEDYKYSVLNVYRNNSLLWTTVMPFIVENGHLSVFGGSKVRNLYVTGLNQYISTHIWQFARPAVDEIKSLVSPLFWSLYERSDGTILMAPTDFLNGSSGSVDSTALIVDHVPNDVDWHSIIKITGAEVYATYVDPVLIRRGARPIEYDSPYLWTETACLNQAFRMGEYERKSLNKKGSSMFFDPRIEVGTVVTIGGSEFVVTDYSASVSSPRRSSAMMKINVREK